MAKFFAYTYPEGISLNGREYLLDEPDGDPMAFPSIQELLSFINKHSDVAVSNMAELESTHGIYIERLDYKERMFEMLDDGQLDPGYLLDAFIKGSTEEELELLCNLNDIYVSV